MKKQDLKAEIDRVWGPYSEQSICFRSLINELDESQKSYASSKSHKIESREKIKNEYLETTTKNLTKNVADATLSFYFTRAFFILGAWSILSVALILVGFLAWAFLF